LGTLPAACAVVTAIQALYMLLVALGNLTDYDANEPFVRHVLVMDTTNFGQPPGEGLDPDVMWRAIDSPAVQTALYLVIIVWEVLAAAVLIWAAAAWVRAFRRGQFGSARRISSVGFLMVATLFFGGFITVGGEWFQMWRSQAWNGLEAAFRNAALAMLGLILLHLPSPDWNEPGGPGGCENGTASG
jgi:predicted small integral membrane protein